MEAQDSARIENGDILFVDRYANSVGPRPLFERDKNAEEKWSVLDAAIGLGALAVISAVDKIEKLFNRNI